jgi:hypothetical protein
VNTYTVMVSFRPHFNSTKRAVEVLTVQAGNQDVAKVRAGYMLGSRLQSILWDSVRVEKVTRKVTRG